MRALVLLFVLLPSLALAQTAAGLWRTEPSEIGAYADVRVAPCAGGGGTLCGVIAEVHNTDRTDMRGRVMIRDMAPAGAGRWSGGTVWAPDDDRTYRGRLRLQGAGLRVEGCVLGGLFCRGQTWTRID